MHLPASQDIPFCKQLECDVAESCCLTWPGQKCLNVRKGPFLASAVLTALLGQALLFPYILQDKVLPGL